MRLMGPLPGLLMVSMLAITLVGCASRPAPSSDNRPYSASTDGPGDHRLVLSELTERVRNLPKSRSGNPMKYSVFGREYEVMDSAKGHVEEGLASWYGAKFHGRLTSSGEPYDMHVMTAAHKHLPLPTFVKVTRTDTGTSLVVKVNDRGPFVDDRIIDLSYAAAVRMDMLDSGTVPVRIEALTSHEVDEAIAAGPRPSAPASQTSGTNDKTTLPVLQFGAFSLADNAEALQAQLNPVLDIPIIIVEDVQNGLYRVQSGPLYDQGSLDAVMSSLANAGIRQETVLRRSP